MPKNTTASPLSPLRWQLLFSPIVCAFVGLFLREAPSCRGKGGVCQPANRLSPLHRGNRMGSLKASSRPEKIRADYVLVERESSHGLIEKVPRLSFAGIVETMC